MISFYIFGAVAVVASLLVIAQRNPIYSVLLLIASFGALSGLYILLEAPFVAVIQIIVYAGAIMVLFVFVVMLLNLKAEVGLRVAAGPQRWGALLLGAAFVALLFNAIRGRLDQAYVETGMFDPAFGAARGLGGLLFSKYLFAFEAASFLLIAAMIGAVVMAKRRVRR